MIRLRGFRKHDLAGLYELDQACFSREIAYSIAELRSFLIHSQSLCWVAEVNDADGGLRRRDRVAGFIIVERIWDRQRPGDGMTGHVITIDVDLTQRRKGVGSLLIQTAEEQLKAEGASRMCLEVAENNYAALEFYRRHGFSITRRIPKYYSGNLDAEVMEKSM